MQKVSIKKFKRFNKQQLDNDNLINDLNVCIEIANDVNLAFADALKNHAERLSKEISPSFIVRESLMHVCVLFFSFMAEQHKCDNKDCNAEDPETHMALFVQNMAMDFHEMLKMLNDSRAIMH